MPKLVVRFGTCSVYWGAAFAGGTTLAKGSGQVADEAYTGVLRLQGAPRLRKVQGRWPMKRILGCCVCRGHHACERFRVKAEGAYTVVLRLQGAPRLREVQGAPGWKEAHDAG
jgi:hypothetical protein